MPVVAAVFALAAATWGLLCARRGSLLVGCGLLLVVGYALGHEFWNAKFGPIPLTLDRIVLLGLLGTFAYQWRYGSLRLRPLTGTDWMLAAMLALFIASAVLSGQPDITDGVTSKWGRLVTSFLIPALLYAIIRQLDITRQEWSRMLAALVVLGFYLGVTGVLEVAGRWSLVFPRYIADPTLGIHFGRARGPELNSVSLGMYLSACLLCGWTLLQYVSKRSYQLAILIALPLMAGAVLFTFTRSTWIGLAASGVVVGWFLVPRDWRMPAVAVGGVLGLMVMVASWGQLLGIKREGTVEDSEHSVSQRQSFAYVSWHMFRDNPILGVGFGRFYDRKLPYLSDRSQNFELESLRPLHHHNTLLSVLTETGLVGLAAFVGVFIAWSRSGWRLATGGVSSWTRAQGILMLALIVNYLCSAVFHDLTLLPSQQLLLFAFAAVTVNIEQRSAMNPAPEASSNAWRPLWGNPLCQVTSDSAAVQAPTSPCVQLLGMRVARNTMQQAVGTIIDWCAEPRGASARFVVTPNVDHAVLFHQRADVRAAYQDASLVLADGTPLVWAARLLRQPLPERVAGSDVVPKIFASARKPMTVFLLGAAPGVAEQAASRIMSQWPNVRVVGTYAPPIGFEKDPAENERIFNMIGDVRPDLLIVGFGAPKQELWVHQHQHAILAKVAICAGATIDFLAGHRRRSPVWMRRVGLEWLHRLASEPRRLASRYARDAWIFPQLVWNQWRKGQA